MNMLRTYQSTSSFIETIQEKMNDKFTSAILYFENKDVSVNQFDKTVIKPVFIMLKCKNKNIYLNHKKIVCLYLGQLNVSVSDRIAKNMPEDKDVLCELMIQNEKKKFNDIEYYPSFIYVCGNQTNIENIRKQEINSYEPEEKEIPLDAMK